MPDTDIAEEVPPPPTRTLASLNWPYVPEESAYPDPLKRDDPKPLQVPQYEAMGSFTVLTLFPNVQLFPTQLCHQRFVEYLVPTLGCGKLYFLSTNWEVKIAN